MAQRPVELLPLLGWQRCSEASGGSRGMVLKEDGASEEAYTYLSMMWLLSLRPKYLAVQLSSFLQVRRS